MNSRRDTLLPKAMKLYEEGYSLRATGEALGVSFGLLGQWLRKSGVKMRTAGQGGMIELRNRDKILDMYKTGHTVREIAQSGE